MAFVRRRGNSTALVETFREGGKVQQRVITNLNGSDSVREELVKALVVLNVETIAAEAEFSHGSPTHDWDRNRAQEKAREARWRAGKLLPYLPEGEDRAAIEREVLAEVATHAYRWAKPPVVRKLRHRLADLDDDDEP